MNWPVVTAIHTAAASMSALSNGEKESSVLNRIQYEPSQSQILTTISLALLE